MVRVGHRRAAKPKRIARTPRKANTHQYLESARIIKLPPGKIPPVSFHLFQKRRGGRAEAA
jgi:hypothetical protein